MTRQDREEKKRQIALKAMDVFAVNGFHQSSIRALASALNISKGTLYEYFESKEDIIRYVAQEYLLNIYKSEIEDFYKDAVNKNLSPKETIRSLFKKGLASPLKIKKYGVILNEIGTITIKNEIPEIKRVFEVVSTDITSFLSDIIKKAQAESSVSADMNPEYIAVFLLSAMTGLGRASEIHESKYDYEAIIDSFIDSFF